MEVFFLPKEAVLMEFKRVNGSGCVCIGGQGSINQSTLSFSYISVRYLNNFDYRYIGDVS
jgi:hypothetical protein